MIGVFGGTFDPIHYGHLRAALDVHQALALGELRFLPLNVPVHREQPRASAAQRRAMVEAAIAGEPGFRVDDRELVRAGRSYSVDTLTSLRDELGDTRPICLLVGGDAFNGFFDWHRPRDILELAHLVVMQRPGAPIQRDARLRTEVERRRATRREELERTRRRAHLVRIRDPAGYFLHTHSAHAGAGPQPALPAAGRGDRDRARLWLLCGGDFPGLARRQPGAAAANQRAILG